MALLMKTVIQCPSRQVFRPTNFATHAVFAEDMEENVMHGFRVKFKVSTEQPWQLGILIDGARQSSKT
jgi:hypothetical protein